MLKVNLSKLFKGILKLSKDCQDKDNKLKH